MWNPFTISWKMQILLMDVNLFLISTKAGFCGIPPTCCAGYKWKSENKSCIACDPGYYGINCINKCIFPSYGIRCLLECPCNKSLCHHSTGCELLVNISTPTAANNSATTAIGEEGMTNVEYLSRQEEKSRQTNMVIFLSTIGLSGIAVMLSCIHIVLCFVDVDVCWRKPGDLDL